MRRLRQVWGPRAAAALLVAPIALGLPCNASAQPVEQHPGLTTRLDDVRTHDGARLRAIVSKPRQGRGRLPAILFVQWLSCDPVALPAEGGDGWAVMMRRLVRESGALVWRTEKRGVGGSQGRCDTLDYETELADHRASP